MDLHGDFCNSIYRNQNIITIVLYNFYTKTIQSHWIQIIIIYSESFEYIFRESQSV